MEMLEVWALLPIRQMMLWVVWMLVKSSEFGVKVIKNVLGVEISERRQVIFCIIGRGSHRGWTSGYELVGIHHGCVFIYCVTFPYHRSTLFPSPCILWRFRRCKQLSVTLPSVCLLVPSRFHFPSFPALICLHHYQSPQPILCQRTLSPHHFTLWTRHSWSGLAQSYYPDDLFHHMFVSCTTQYFSFIISLSYEACFLSYLFVSPYFI